MFLCLLMSVFNCLFFVDFRPFLALSFLLLLDCDFSDALLGTLVIVDPFDDSVFIDSSEFFCEKDFFDDFRDVLVLMEPLVVLDTFDSLLLFVLSVPRVPLEFGMYLVVFEELDDDPSSEAGVVIVRPT